MVNGVFQIIAAVLFTVVHLSTDMGIIWLCIAGAYLVIGIVNLMIYAIRNKHQLHKARKESQKNTAKVEKPLPAAKEKAAQQEPKNTASETENV